MSLASGSRRNAPWKPSFFDPLSLYGFQEFVHLPSFATVPLCSQVSSYILLWLQDTMLKVVPVHQSLGSSVCLDWNTGVEHATVASMLWGSHS